MILNQKYNHGRAPNICKLIPLPVPNWASARAQFIPKKIKKIPPPKSWLCSISWVERSLQQPFNFSFNTPPGAKLGLCRRTIYSKLSTSDHNLFQIFLRESKFFFEHQIFLSWPFLNIWNYQTLSCIKYSCQFVQTVFVSSFGNDGAHFFIRLQRVLLTEVLFNRPFGQKPKFTLWSRKPSRVFLQILFRLDVPNWYESC